MRKNRITESVILALATLISTFVWLSLKDFLFNQGGWVFPLLGFFIICILLSIGWLLIKSRIILFTTLAIILFGFFVAFGFNWIYFITGVIALILFFYGSCQTLDEKNLRIKIRVNKILKLGLPSFLTGLILLISVSYYFSPKSIKDFEVPRPLFDSIMEFMPMPQMGMDLTSLLQGLDLENLNLETQNLEMLTQDGMYDLVNANINSFIEPYEQYLAIGLAVGLFFLLKTLSVPFMWIVIFISWLIFKILVKLEAIKIHEKSVLQEVIE